MSHFTFLSSSVKVLGVTPSTGKGVGGRQVITVVLPIRKEEVKWPPGVFSQMASLPYFSSSGRGRSPVPDFVHRWLDRQQKCTCTAFLGALPQLRGLFSSPGTWLVALETPLCASGISAQRHHISHARVSMYVAT